MILLTEPTEGDFMEVSTVSYEQHGAEHFGLVFTRNRHGGLNDTVGIFYNVSLSLADRDKQVRADVVALYLRTMFVFKIPFVCKEPHLREYIGEAFVDMMYTTRVRLSEAFV